MNYISETQKQFNAPSIERFLVILSFCFLFSVPAFGQDDASGSVQIGLIADVQFASRKGTGRRKYRESLRKLTACVKKFNEEQVDLAIQLGDLIDRKVKNFKPVLSRLKKLNMPLYHVLGNHDFAIDKSGEAVPDILNLDRRYYHFRVRNWTFIVLDGNQISTFAWPESSEKHQGAIQMRQNLKEKGAPNAKTWNGGIGTKQKTWLRTVLKQADQKNQKAIVLCHYPVYPADVHNLYNDQEVIEILESHSSPVAYLSGHNHHGNYGRKNGIHYLTLKGMVDTDQNSFAIMELFPDRLNFRGFGREKHRTLHISEKAPR